MVDEEPSVPDGRDLLLNLVVRRVVGEFRRPETTREGARRAVPRAEAVLSSIAEEFRDRGVNAQGV